MHQDIENIIKKNLPEIKEHICRFNDGECVCDCFKECISQINTSLIADEVLKVVVEKMANVLKDIPWANRNECENEKVICENEVLELLSNLSPNKENKK